MSSNPWFLVGLGSFVVVSSSPSSNKFSGVVFSISSIFSCCPPTIGISVCTFFGLPLPLFTFGSAKFVAFSGCTFFGLPLLFGCIGSISCSSTAGSNSVSDTTFPISFGSSSSSKSFDRVVVGILSDKVSIVGSGIDEFVIWSVEGISFKILSISCIFLTLDLLIADGIITGSVILFRFKLLSIMSRVGSCFLDLLSVSNFSNLVLFFGTFTFLL